LPRVASLRCPGDPGRVEGRSGSKSAGASSPRRRTEKRAWQRTTPAARCLPGIPLGPRWGEKGTPS
jgi:hypothetical protein